jgi:hypothetical protein
VKTLWLTLWDEEGRRLVGFRDLPEIRRRLEQEGSDDEAISPTKPEAVPRGWQ